MLRRTALLTLAAAAATAGGEPIARPWLTDAQAPIPARVASLLAAMTQTEKIAQLWYGSASSSSPSGILAQFPNGTGSLYHSGDVATRNAIQAAFINGTRLGIPVSFMAETMRSAGLAPGVIYPIPALLGASWNTTLLGAIGRAIGEEATALGLDRSLSPVLQVAIDQRWGRVLENFGETPLHVAAMGAAMARGLAGAAAGSGVDTYLNDSTALLVTAKHAVAYGTSVTDGYTADVSPQTLMDVFIAPWRALVAAGGRGAMISHPSVNWTPMHANGGIINGVLRDVLGWGDALMGSDNENIQWLYAAFRYAANATQAAAMGVSAGVDQEMSGGPGSVYLSQLALAVSSGMLGQADLDNAVARVLTAKFAAGLFDTPYTDPSRAPAAVRTPAHVALAGAAAADSITLLLNGGGIIPLPLKSAASPIHNIAVLGPSGGGCDTSNLTAPCTARGNMVGNYAPYSAAPGATGLPPVATVEDALRAALAAGAYPALQTVTYARGADIDTTVFNASQVANAVTAAAAADAVVLVLGDSACVAPVPFAGCTCGEGADRASFDLPGTQQVLLQAVLNATGNLAGVSPPPQFSSGGPPIPFYSRAGGPVPVILVLMHGRTATFDSANDNWLLTPGFDGPAQGKLALFAAWQPSEQGAAAILSLLDGSAPPAGRLAQSWPRSVGHVRSPGSPWWQLPSSQGSDPAWFAPRDNSTWRPLFPMGYGLSTTTWSVSNVSIVPEGQVPITPGLTFNITATVTNTGSVDGPVVLYAVVRATLTGVMALWRRLAGFTKVFVPAGSAVAATIQVNGWLGLDRWDASLASWVVEPGTYTFSVADCVDDGGIYTGAPVAPIPVCNPVNVSVDLVTSNSKKK